MGYEVVVLCDWPDDPAAAAANHAVCGSSADREILQQFAKQVRATTIEFENVSADGLDWLAKQGVLTRPNGETVRVCQDRIREKTFLTGIGVPVAPWRPIRNQAELREAAQAITFPAILKTSSSGYDGKGQTRLEHSESLSAAWIKFGEVPCVLEQVVSFVAELSVIAARGSDGQTAVYPVNWNTHRRHILDTTVAPAPIGPILALEARELATKIIQMRECVGMLAVEMFLDAQNQLIVNELAPRPHNSGHWTMEATPCSQFEQQVRTLCGLPLGETRLLSGSVAMANLLGDLWNNGPPDWASALALDPEVRLHLYGKKGAVPGRKMGHLVVTDNDFDAARARVIKARNRLNPGPRQ